MPSFRLLLVVTFVLLLSACNQGSPGTPDDPEAPDEPLFVPSSAVCEGAPEGTRYVDHRAVMYGDGLSFAEPHKSIREALLYSPNHICIAPGTYIIESTLRLGQGVTLEGGIEPGDGSAEVVLDGQGAGNVIRVEQGKVELKSLTITNGGGILSTTGAIVVDRGGDLTLLNTAVLDSRASFVSFPTPTPGLGGGIYNLGVLRLGSATIVSGNEANDGGGVFNEADGELTVESGARVDGNIVTGRGGGIYNLGTLTILSGSEVTGNMTDGDVGSGGGIYTAVPLAPGSTITVVTGNTPDNIAP